ncbi:hypothetical protein ABZ619_07410 [Streptomyces sp. NPDC007851]|uniref:hypothetical protein n=1 Tax=Streptomyces sp. NPDC007851 TaxID=3155008 RepID=UPI0033C5C130
MTEWPPPAAADVPSPTTRNTHILELGARHEEQPYGDPPAVRSTEAEQGRRDHAKVPGRHVM